MEPVVVQPDRNEAVLRIRTGEDARLTGEHSLTIRATAQQSGGLLVLSEATVPFTLSK